MALLMLVIVLMGLLSLDDIKRETFPEFIPTEVQVSIAYPGASTQQSQQSLCIPLEDAIDSINALEELRCEAFQGLVKLTAVMAEGGNIQSFLNDINTQVDSIDSFPDLAKSPLVLELGRNELVASIALTGDMPILQLKQYSDVIKSKLQQIQGVSGVTIQGFSSNWISIELDMMK